MGALLGRASPLHKQPLYHTWLGGIALRLEPLLARFRNCVRALGARCPWEKLLEDLSAYFHTHFLPYHNKPFKLVF